MSSGLRAEDIIKVCVVIPRNKDEQ